MPVSYTIALSAVADGNATFEVTRSASNGDVAWVTTDCFDANGTKLPEDYDDAPVVWGTDTSLTGLATLPVSGASCTAIVTRSPWRPKHNDPSVTFEV